MIKVSFDFDDTLDNVDVQCYAKELVQKGIDVHIVTSRYEKSSMYSKNEIKSWGILNLIDEHNYLFEVAKDVGILDENIHFTNMANKEFFFIKNPEFLWHIDNNSKELEEINSSTNVHAISVYDDYKKICNNIINNYGNNNIK